jgi:hypothetical protein
MITVFEIRDQALKWYGGFLRSIVTGEGFFPRDIRFKKIMSSQVLRDFQRIKNGVEELVKNSAAVIGFGYRVESTEVNNRKIGRQKFPTRIYFDNEMDYLKFIRKEKDFKDFVRIKERLSEELPSIGGWIVQHPFKLTENTDKWEDIVKVCRYFLEHPRPNCYIRELDIPVHTKFIEENEAIIKSLLDYLLPPGQVNREADGFSKRFYLKSPGSMVRFRLLDVSLVEGTCWGITDCSVPVSQFERLDIPCRGVIITENLMNFLTLPLLEKAIGLWGKGFQVSLLKGVRWLADKIIIYWGDIDTHGLRILSELRSIFPRVRSVMMDFETLETYRKHTGIETTPNRKPVEHLASEEQRLYDYLLETGMRLEQEKIDQWYANERIKRLLANQNPGTKAISKIL